MKRRMDTVPDAPVPQWSEEATHNRQVAGSIPARRTAPHVGLTGPGVLGGDVYLCMEHVRP